MKPKILSKFKVHSEDGERGYEVVVVERFAEDMYGLNHNFTKKEAKDASGLEYYPTLQMGECYMGKVKASLTFATWVIEQRFSANC